MKGRLCARHRTITPWFKPPSAYPPHPRQIFAIASFLASCADLPNLREHLERALVLLPHPPHAARLWDMYTRIEAQFGTAASQACPHCPPRPRSRCAMNSVLRRHRPQAYSRCASQPIVRYTVNSALPCHRV